ncbi:MAG TPA: hypothetical protein V6D37_12920 [Candidatus Sericytochromatia bacterium]
MLYLTLAFSDSTKQNKKAIALSSQAFDKLLREIDYQRRMKITLAQQLNTAFVPEYQDQLRQAISHTEIKLDRAIVQLVESVTAPVEDSEVIKLETPSTNSDETEAKIASPELAAMKLQYEERIAALEQALTKAAPPQTSSKSQAQLGINEQLRQGNLQLAKQLSQKVCFPVAIARCSEFVSTLLVGLRKLVP